MLYYININKVNISHKYTEFEYNKDYKNKIVTILSHFIIFYLLIYVDVWIWY